MSHPPNYQGGPGGYGNEKSQYQGPPPVNQYPPQQGSPYQQGGFPPPPPGQQQQQYAPPPQPQGGFPPPPPGQFSPPPGPPPPQQFSPPPSAPPPGQQAVFDPNRPALPPTPMQAQPAEVVKDTHGQFNGGQYHISHRDCNTLLTLELQHGCPVQAKPGTMVAMDPSVTLKGQVKFSLKKMLAGGELAQSTYTGPGQLLLAPPALGDIVPIRLDGSQTWSVGKDAMLCSTQGIVKDYKSQGLGKAMFSGEGLFVYKISGQGLIFVTSLGAIICKNMAQGQQFVVDNDHLVAWNCKYTIERVASGGILSGMAAAEGLVCRFTGPGTVFFQTRNPTAFGAWIASHMGTQAR